MSNSELAVVAIVAVAFLGLLAYLAAQTQPSMAGSEVWEVQSDSQGIPERVIVRR